MQKEVKITAIVKHDSFGAVYVSQTLEITVPDAWGLLDAIATKNLDKLLKHYLQIRWHEQYLICCSNQPFMMQTTSIKERAVDDVKKMIDSDRNCGNTKQLAENIAGVDLYLHKKCLRLSQKHPIIIDDPYEGYSNAKPSQ